MMDITKSREDFEAWAEKNGYRMDLIPNSDIYSYSSTRCSWEAWQAARESIVVELPPRKSADIESEKYPDMTMYEAMMREGIWNDCIFECEKILRTAGIRIKGESE
ncbi:hypothetical protein [Yersinia frederiksenii]|uniref:hypothetical protein n=1 Tax=Yersinia frederiksenii TaxID=29484 RepID=UPI0005E9FB2A|nr:hypothetical protein [Yersinia frederiksenii]CQI98124.1 Uncharacterised protein [Yersinia frederiksenii]